MTSDNNTKYCKYCKKRIVKINYALGPQWVHQTAGASFQDDVHTYCEITVATPEVGSA